ncbi:unnamed protein product [Brassica oleracea var. botrytis]|uniref:diaminopimelate epimerase n=1 Tax=Brassica oleracea TaxID=3712 RepID=A0A3P6GKC8_BRAOL|nr:unnamed protein product [Brassica oleracea]
MEIAAASTVSVAPQLPRLTNAFSRKLGSVSSLSFGSLKRNYCVGKVSASSSVDVITADKISPASFLDKRETGGVLHFVKYHGLGNDFILVDNRDSSEPKITQEQAAKLCDRNFGVGADGVIFAMPGVNGTDYTMRIFNSDGSEPEMCGNGVRCFARFIAELERTCKGKTVVLTALWVVQVKVDMGIPILKAQDVPTKLPGNKGEAVIQAELVVDGVSWNVTCVSMGNPHCITFEFVEVLSRSHLKMRVWERGAGATLACGTGACALVVAAVLEGRANRFRDTDEMHGGSAWRTIRDRVEARRQPYLHDWSCRSCLLRISAALRGPSRSMTCRPSSLLFFWDLCVVV